MEIRNKFFGTFAILCLILSLGMVMAEEVITPEDIERFKNPVERDAVIKNYIPNVAISGLENSKSELSSEGILTIEKDGVPLTLDTKNLPQGLSEIKYNDGYLDFTYENGPTVSIAQGSINNENKLTGIKNGDVDYGPVELGLEEGGNVEVDENGLISLSGKAEVKMGDREFYVAEGKESGSVQKLGDNSFMVEGGINTGKTSIETDTTTEISYGTEAPIYDREGSNLHVNEDGEEIRVTGKVGDGSVLFNSEEEFLSEVDGDTNIIQEDLIRLRSAGECDGSGCRHSRINNGGNAVALAGAEVTRKGPIRNVLRGVGKVGGGAGRGVVKITKGVLRGGRNAVRGLFKGRPIRSAVKGVGKVLGNIKIRPLKGIGKVVRGIGKIRPLKGVGKIGRGALRGGGKIIKGIGKLRPLRGIGKIGRGGIRIAGRAGRGAGRVGRGALRGAGRAGRGVLRLTFGRRR
jgi:hypothetical protein